MTCHALAGIVSRQETHLPNELVRRLPHGLLCPDRRVGRNLHQVTLVTLLHRVEEISVAAELFVGRDPIETHGTPGHQRGGDLRFRLERDLRRDARLLPPHGVRSPRFRQIQLVIQQGGACRSRAEEEHAHLAVLLLAHASAPLPLHSDALRAALDKARPVDHAHRADRRLGCRGHELLVKHRLDSCCTSCASQGETVRNRCQAKTMFWSMFGCSSDGPPKSKAIGSTLFRPPASSSPRRYPKQCSWHSRRPKHGAKRPCKFSNRAAAAQFDRIHDKVLLQTSMKRRTGQLDKPFLLYDSKPKNLQ